MPTPVVDRAEGRSAAAGDAAVHRRPPAHHAAGAVPLTSSRATTTASSKVDLPRSIEPADVLDARLSQPDAADDQPDGAMAVTLLGPRRSPSTRDSRLQSAKHEFDVAG